MSGARKFRSEGQLALLDAIVFFIVATTVSAMLWCQADLRRAGSGEGADEASPMTGEVLASFLQASICKSVVLHLPDEYTLRPETAMSTCLMLEAEALFGGAEPSSFAELNGVIYAALTASLGSLWEPYLCVYELSGHEPREVFAMPGTPPDQPISYSAGATIPCAGGTLLATLVLAPSSLPELPQVA